MINFALGIHNHQPVDNFDFVFERVYHEAYRPFLEVLREFERVKINLHLSGSLLEWLLARHPDYVDALRTLVDARRIEILTSGFYEPVLTLLPEEDRVDQIKAYSERLAGLFGARPKGLWLTERVWEQSLASSLVRSGVEYVVVDDTHFRNMGVPDEKLAGYYVTEDQGRILSVFPISKRLRYLVPFHDVSETTGFLHEQAGLPGAPLATLFDDGEKFGSWPGTHGHVYGDAVPKLPLAGPGAGSKPDFEPVTGPGWLRRFFHEASHDPEVSFTLFSEYRDANPALGRIYLDNAAYEEMGEWAMSPERHARYERVRARLEDDSDSLEFLRTGYFRNFLAKYDEANRLHKRMIFVSNKIRRSRKPEDKLLAARTELFKGQANDAYWHGIFGGLYLPHLRQGAYRHLLQADNLLAENAALQMLDFDGCGRKEIVFDYRQVFVALNPNLGGTLIELDVKEKGINWLDTITRRPESYHSELTEVQNPGTGVSKSGRKPAAAPKRPLTIHERKPPASGDAGLDLRYDPVPRLSLLDHFYPLETAVDSCRNATAKELASVALAPRNFEIERHKVVMSLIDFLPEKPSHLYKEVSLENDSLLVTCDTHANFWQPYRFAVDLNVLPLRELQVAGQGFAPTAVGSEKKAAEVKLIHESGATLVVRAGKIPFGVWFYPIETISRSEQGIERIYQGTALVLNWEQHKPAGVFEFEIAWA